jgi:adenylate cyclase
MGEVGTSYKDFTAIGPVVNLASRLLGSAKPGEILVSENALKFIEKNFPQAEQKALTLKGFSESILA